MSVLNSPIPPQAARAGRGRTMRSIAPATSSFQSTTTPAPADPVAAYNGLPWYDKALTAANDTARLVANGGTLGYGDRLAAWGNSKLGYGDYDTNLTPARPLARQTCCNALPARMPTLSGML